ncbi:hypothetical protein SAMN00790413_03497 [Deinococcus hopiensis KR-140]|uniref:Uncharacterized protein n=2 Tax=Deinococcus TaxID=1298 RepID=A0A1W1UX47_9DEIO|nr:hypothetical protein SAMN00790413_03497 [Deinococcus hopiensis KR-140]
MADANNIQWIKAGSVAAWVTSPDDPDPTPAARPLTLWTVPEGNLRMALHEDILYVSPMDSGAEIMDADRRAARAFGYYGPLPVQAPT